MLFLRFPLLASWHAPYLPHILKLWSVIQSCNKHALKLLQATLKKALSSLKINHKIPIPTI
ncbi:hypothetical protein [Helicobacter pylori]|uniref:hypothetical protein n=1 Tax=Helicobacter pylori TaxID=210 RepID=UPI000A846350|nr:hypothetical protein [Helicobacter pylori]